VLVTKHRRWILLFVVYLSLLGLGWLASQWVPQFLEMNISARWGNISPRSELFVHRAIMTAAAIYILTSALPFVPGAEIGFGLIMLFGGKIALLVYVGMVSALILAFLVGRHLPLHILAAAFKKLGFERAHAFILKLKPLNGRERLALITENTPSRSVPFMLRHRYLLLMLALNLPGNSLVGGGGGIAFVAGLSGLFSYIGFFTAIAFAVSPVPVFFFLTQ
jgi:hypothetical protein